MGAAATGAAAAMRKAFRVERRRKATAADATANMVDDDVG